MSDNVDLCACLNNPRCKSRELHGAIFMEVRERAPAPLQKIPVGQSRLSGASGPRPWICPCVGRVRLSTTTLGPRIEHGPRRVPYERVKSRFSRPGFGLDTKTRKTCNARGLFLFGNVEEQAVYPILLSDDTLWKTCQSTTRRFYALAHLAAGSLQIFQFLYGSF